MDETWEEEIGSKPSLEVYRRWKERGRTAYGLYQNGRGSALLALARAGMLPTRSHRSKYQQMDPRCIRCGTGSETIPHIILKCQPHQNESEELARRLGFTGDDENEWRDTRSMLEIWENETRRIC